MIINFYKKGNKIHIKESNKGKFTDYCGGKVTDECILKAKHSSNSKLRKRAIFAENARKWKHAKGGSINGSSTNPEGLKELPSLAKQELIKKVLKKYPGLTEALAAGKAPIKIKGKTYAINNGNLVLIKLIGGRLIRRALGGMNIAGIIKDAGYGILLAIQAGKNLDLKNKLLELLELLRLYELLLALNNAYMNGLQATLTNNHYKSENPIDPTSLGIHTEVNFAGSLPVNTLPPPIQQPTLYGNQKLPKEKDKEKELPKDKEKEPQGLPKVLKQSEWDRTKNAILNSNPNETMALTDYRVNSLYMDLYNLQQLLDGVNKADQQRLAEQQLLSELLEANFLKKSKPEFKLQKGGDIHKPFGHYEDPTDDVGKVDIKTRKLIKRPKSYHRYNIGG